MRLIRMAVAATAVIMTATLAACSSSEQTSTASGDAVTIKHAYGETVIDAEPERIATVNWANHEVPLALGVVPVGMSKVTWGDEDGDGMLPWTAEAIEKLGGETPALFDDTDAIPYEEVAATEPDIILATYSGITEEEYEQLSKIAPTVAFPETAWGTSLEDMIEISSQAMWKEAEGKQLVTDLEKQIQQDLDERPALKDKSFVFSAFGTGDDLSKITFYTPEDTRVGFLQDHGLTVPKVVTENSEAGSFYAEVSAEKPELFDDVDFFITYGTDDDKENEKQLKALQNDPLVGRIPAIKAGNVVFLGEGTLATLANPSPLSISWGLGKYLDELETVAKK